MDIEYAILGMLSWQPMSGYDLKKRISESDLFYWSGNNNQIYYSLMELRNRGLVTQEVQAQENLPAKKMYSITEAGREQLRKWAAAAPELPERRQNFLIQLAWAESLPTPVLLGLLDVYEQEVVIQLRMRQARPPAPDTAPRRSERESYLWDRINQKLLAEYEEEIKWVRQVRAEIAARFSQPPSEKQEEEQK